MPSQIVSWSRLLGTAALLLPLIIIFYYRESVFEAPNSATLRVERTETLTRPPNQPKQPSKHCSREITFASAPLPLTSLASFPRSGNSWTRFLIEQATGIYTGSVYNSMILKASGMKGEGKQDGSVVLVKTHQQDDKSISKFERAVVLVRNPYNSVLSYFYYSKVKALSRQLPDSAFSDPAMRGQWREFLQGNSKAWFSFHRNWIGKFQGDMLIVRYEDLKANTTAELRKLLDFLQQPYVNESLDCIATGSGYFYVPKKPPSIFDESYVRVIDCYHDVVDEMISRKRQNLPFIPYNNSCPAFPIEKNNAIKVN